MQTVYLYEFINSKNPILIKKNDEFQFLFSLDSQVISPHKVKDNTPYVAINLNMLNNGFLSLSKLYQFNDLKVESFKNFPKNIQNKHEDNFKQALMTAKKWVTRLEKELGFKFDIEDKQKVFANTSISVLENRVFDIFSKKIGNSVIDNAYSNYNYGLSM